MKCNKFLTALALCVALQPAVNFAAEPEQVPQVLSYWQQYAPQRLQDMVTTVNNWSTKKKIAVAGTIIATLAAIYNRDQIMQWVSGVLEQQKAQQDLGSVEIVYENNPNLPIHPEAGTAWAQKIIDTYVTLQKAADDAEKDYKLNPSEQKLGEMRSLMGHASQALKTLNDRLIKALGSGSLSEDYVNTALKAAAQSLTK